MAITAAQVQELYVAYLGRAADKAGLEYWLGELNDPASGLTLENLRANFVNEQPEYTAAYGGLGVAQTVARIYDNLFERAFDQAGLNYWVGEVNAGRVPVDQLLVAFLNAASATDRQVVSNKVLVAEAYTAAFAGNFNKAGAAAAIGAVDGSPASVNAALNKITADSNGLTLLLSAGADLGAAYVGGPGNDTFLANDNSHLQVVDVLDGGAGSDRLVFAGRQGVADNVFANVSSIESVEFLQAVAEGDIYRLGANAAAAGVTDVFLRNEAHVLSLQGFDRDLAVTGSSLADRVAVDLADAGDKTLNLGGGFDNIVILAEPGAAAGATVVSFVSADVGSNSAAAVRIDGSQGDVFTENTRVIIRGTQTDQFSVIGSDAAGNLLSNQDRGDFKTLLLGTSGNDQLTVVAASEPGSVYVNAGAGADILNATALADQRHFLVGGVGSDTFNVQTTAASGRVVIISGPGDDVINVGVGEAPAHSGSVDVTLVSGTNTVTFAEGLTLNTADIAANDRLTGGTGRDTLAATAAQLLAVATPGSSEQQSVSGFEVLTVTDAQLGLASGDGLVAARIQAGIDTINLEGSSVGSAGITFDGTTDATLNLKAAMATGASLNVTMAGSDSDDRLTITNAAAGNVFNGATLNASGVETLILEGSGSDAAGLQTLGDIA